MQQAQTGRGRQRAVGLRAQRRRGRRGQNVVEDPIGRERAQLGGVEAGNALGLAGDEPLELGAVEPAQLGGRGGDRKPPRWPGRGGGGSSPPPPAGGTCPPVPSPPGGGK